MLIIRNPWEKVCLVESEYAKYMEPHEHGVPKYDTLSAEEQRLINNAVQELVDNKIVPEGDEGLQREIRYQIAEIEPGESESLKIPLTGTDGKPVKAIRDEKGGGVKLVYGESEGAE